MFRLAVFFFVNLIIFNSAKVILTDLENNGIDQDSGSEEKSLFNFHSSEYEDNNNLWVLYLNDGSLDVLKLRSATVEDKKDFDFYTKPLIERYNSTVVKKDVPKPATPEAVNDTNLVTKEDIFKYLNKLTLYSKTEPDSYLSDSHASDDPSITLYFKGKFTSLIVTLGMEQWHYFVKPSSLFPSWFYEEGVTNAKAQAEIEIPEEVKNKFYPALFRLLQIVLKYPMLVV